MKMAKASEKDIDAAGNLLSILNTIDKRFGGPWPTCEGPESIDEAIKGNDGVFDEEDIDHLRGLYNSLAKLLREAPGFHNRVIGGMCYVVLFEENQIVDPADDCLALHPRFAQVEQQRDELLAALEFARGKIAELHIEAGDGDCHYPLIDDAIARAEGGAA